MLLLFTGPALLSTLLLGAASADCRGIICKAFKDVPVVSQGLQGIDAWTAKMKERGSTEDVLNQATSFSAWDNPFKPANGPADEHYLRIEYRCTKVCICPNPSTEPNLMRKGTSLLFFNECGGQSHGEVLGQDSLRADDWHLTVAAKNDGKLLEFSNGTLWELR
jgi:hypothetical protein